MRALSLTAMNTLGVPATAQCAITVSGDDDLGRLVEAVRRAAGASPGQQVLTVLGGGSNVILRRRLAGVVALMRTRGLRVEPEAGGARLTVAAGVRWHDLVRYTLGQGLAGLENLALIPGAVGAAPIQNIGAYGVELAERFVSLRAMDVATGRIHRFSHADCGFGYRHSRFKEASSAGLVILDVTLRLSHRSPPVIDYPELQTELARLGWRRPSAVQVAEAVIRIRRRKLPDPRFVGNVGSFFKNPVVNAATAAEVRRRLPAAVARPADGGVKLSAAQLIDACGWKGRVAGAVGVWHRQPLVLVNRGGASGAEFLALGEQIRRSVADRFGVRLELEPQVIGSD